LVERKIISMKHGLYLRLAVLAALLCFGANAAWAQTVSWERKAFGQQFSCFHSGTQEFGNWPNNANWSQSETFSDPCSNGTQIETAPSNWTTPNYPNGAGIDVVLGNAGAAGTNLDLQVTLHSLTIQSAGSLNAQFGSAISANIFDFQGDGTLSVSGGGGPWPVLTVGSGGTLMKSGGAGTYTLDPGVVVMANGATISSKSGTLALPGNSSSYTNDTFTATAGAIVDLVPTGNYHSGFNGSFTGGGAGTLRLSGGELDTVSNTTFNFPGSFFQWTGGVLSSGSAATFTNAGTLTISGPVGIGGIGFTNNGTIIQSGSGTPNFPFGGGLTNAANATYDLRSDLGWTVGGGGGATPFFNNSGTLLKSAGTGTSTLDPSLLLNNTGGTIQVNTGTLVLPGIGTSTGGKFVVASGATLNLMGSNNTALFDGTYTGSGAGTVLLNNGTLRTSSGGTFNLPGALFQWAGGTIASQSASPFTNAGNISVVGPVGLGGVGFTNSGVMVQSGSGTINAGFGSGFTNAAGATYDIQNDLDMTSNGGGGAGPFLNNAGTLVKSAGTGTSTIDQAFTNTGSLLLKSGTLAFAVSFDQTAGVTDLSGGNLSSTNDMFLDGGSLIGTGTITGNLRNRAGIVAPGHSPGKITVNGNYIQGTGGVLNMEIGGTTPGTAYDQLVVSGGAALDGTLNITAINGFTPAKGDIYTLVSATSFSGQFSTVNVSGFTAKVDYSTNGVTMTITSTVSELLNISTRMEVLDGDNVLIGGFIVTGNDAKKVLIRGLGPSLPISGVLADPVLELHDSSGATIATNDNWKIADATGQSQEADIRATTVPPSSDLESAMIATLPGNTSKYTAVLKGKSGGMGVGQVEVYDLNQAASSHLANISTRGFIDTGDNVMIGGIIAGPASSSGTKVLVRAIGPSLPVNGALQDTLLELHDANGATIATNDNWKINDQSGQSQQADIEATGAAPTNELESALLQTVAPGNYTAIVKGKDKATGIGLVEVYNLQ
jgi:hypothetical protein